MSSPRCLVWMTLLLPCMYWKYLFVWSVLSLISQNNCSCILQIIWCSILHKVLLSKRILVFLLCQLVSHCGLAESQCFQVFLYLGYTSWGLKLTSSPDCHDLAQHGRTAAQWPVMGPVTHQIVLFSARVWALRVIDKGKWPSSKAIDAVAH